MALSWERCQELCHLWNIYQLFPSLFCENTRNPCSWCFWVIHHGEQNRFAQLQEGWTELNSPNNTFGNCRGVPQHAPPPFLHPQPFSEHTEDSGQTRRKPEMNNIPRGHLKLNVFRESLFTRLPAGWFYLLSIQARFGLNCNPVEKGKGV